MDVRTERARSLVAPAVEQIIRLEGYFRIHGFDHIAAQLEGALQSCDEIMTGLMPVAGGPGDGNDGAPQPVDPEEQPYSAEWTPATRGRAALG